MRQRSIHMALAAGALAIVLSACGGDSGGDTAGAETTVTTAAATDTPAVRFVSPADGAGVKSPVTLQMRATNFAIEPAGEVRDGAGHFHVMVDVGCVSPGQTIPGDAEAGYNHYGKGQTTAELELAIGEHTLCLQVGDGAHIALGLAQQITITVTG